MKIQHTAKRPATNSLGAIGVPPKRSIARQRRQSSAGLVLEGRPLSEDTLKKNLEVEMEEYHSSPKWRRARGPPQEGVVPDWEVSQNVIDRKGVTHGAAPR